MPVLAIGSDYELRHTFTPEQVLAFAGVTGDDNPIHIEPSAVDGTRFEKNIVHGIFLLGLVSRVLGREFPGEGTVYVSQDVRFRAPVYVDETVVVRCEVVEQLERGRLRLTTQVLKADGTVAITGSAVVIPPKEQS